LFFHSSTTTDKGTHHWNTSIISCQFFSYFAPSQNL